MQKCNPKLKVPEFESPVAYDKSATLGSTPNAIAVSAEEIAIEASSSLVGSVFIAQSPNHLWTRLVIVKLFSQLIG